MSSHGHSVSTECADHKHKTSLASYGRAVQLPGVKIGDRIKQAREAKGWSQGALGERVGKAQTAISSWERNRTEPGREDVARIEKALALEPGQLELDTHRDLPRATGYPLVGKVGAGGQGLYEDDYARGHAVDYIEPLPGMPIEAEIIALETDGDSMAPLVFDGDLAFFGPIRRDVDTLLNKRVMARLDDGRKYFKILKRGSTAGLYTLRSLNPAHEDIEDVLVAWVLPYRGSRPKG